MEPTKLVFSEALIRRAVLAFWFRLTGWRFFSGLLLVAASLIYLISTGDRSWFIGVLASVICIAVLFSAALYFAHYRASISRFRAMQSPQAIFEAGDDTFKITSDVGSSELLWKTIKQVWRFPDFWLLFLSSAHFITFPLADVTPEVRDFILAKIKSNGGRIV